MAKSMNVVLIVIDKKLTKKNSKLLYNFYKGKELKAIFT